MAQAIACDLCGEEVAVLMQSNLGNGDSQAVGQNCLLQFTLTMALAFADGIPPEIGAEYRELTAAIVTRISPDLLAPEKPATARRKRSAVAEAPVDPPEGAQANVTALAERNGTGHSADLAGNTPAGDRDPNVSVAEAALAGLESRLARAGHSGTDDE